MDLSAPAEFTCCSCGLPQSQLPPGHEVTLTHDEHGWPVMICTDAVQRNSYTIECWG